MFLCATICSKLNVIFLLFICLIVSFIIRPTTGPGREGGGVSLPSTLKVADGEGFLLAALPEAGGTSRLIQMVPHHFLHTYLIILFYHFFPQNAYGYPVLPMLFEPALPIRLFPH